MRSTFLRAKRIGVLGAYVLAGASVVAAPVLAQAPPAAVEAASSSQLEAQLGAHLAESGEAPVIVLLRDQSVPAQGRAQRRAARIQQQDDLLAALPTGAFKLRRRLTELNSLVGTASARDFSQLREDPRVEAVYFDGRVQANLVEGRGLIRADLANGIGADGSGVTVAVLDTGVDYTNRNLGDCVAVGPSCKVRGGYDFVNDDADPQDDAGHGTSVAGIVAADGSHPIAASKVTGVAPSANIIALKVLNSSGSGLFSDVDAAFDWILAHPEMGVQVVNLSLGEQGVARNDPNAFPCAGTATAAGVAALNAQGVTVVASSGNDGFDDGVSFPACIHGVIAVGAVYDADVGSQFFTACTDFSTTTGQVTCYSNSDEIVAMVAPSNEARTTSPGPDGVTTDFGGTSAAAPYVAGVAALALHADPTLSPAGVRSRLEASAIQTTSDAESGLTFPIVDARNASPEDADADGILLDGDGSGIAGDAPCAGGASVGCDDNCLAIANADQADGDADGIGDVCDNCPLVAGADQTDSDGDGSGDICDLCTDGDGDGFGDPGPADTCPLDLCPSVTSPDNSDTDGDGIGGGCDNCLAVANPGQEDADEDGLGDICDSCTDSDGDGLGDPGPVDTCEADLCPTLSSPDNSDVDGDGFAPACDNCPALTNAGQEDADADGVGDLCDNCVTVSNPSQDDSNSDGVGNACEGCIDLVQAVGNELPRVRRVENDLTLRRPPAWGGTIDLDTPSAFFSAWGAQHSGDLALPTSFQTGSTCAVIAQGSKRFEIVEIANEYGMPGTECLPGPSQLFPTFTDTAVDRAGRNIAFVSDAPFAPGTDAAPDERQVFLSTNPGGGVVQVSQRETPGIQAARPGINGDGTLVVYASNGNPLGTNLDNNYEIFLYDLVADTTTQITDAQFCNSGAGPIVAGPSISEDGNLISIVSTCDLDPSVGNPFGLLTTYLYDRTLDAFTQLPHCQSGCWLAESASLSRDGRTVVNYDMVGSGQTNQVYLMVHRVETDASVTSRQSCQAVSQGQLSVGEALLLFSGFNIPASSEDGERVAFSAKFNPFGNNPKGFFEVWLMDLAQDLETAKARLVTDGTDVNASFGAAMGGRGEALYLWGTADELQPHSQEFLYAVLAR